MSDSPKCPELCDGCIRAYFCRAFLGESYRADGPCDWEPSRYLSNPHITVSYSPGVGPCSVDTVDAKPITVEQTVGEPVKPIWETVAEMGAAIPDEEWAKVPRDGARNLDHYLYGSPKQEEPVPSALDEMRAACSSLWRQTNEVWRKYEASEKKCGALEAEIKRLRGGKGDGDVDR